MAAVSQYCRAQFSGAWGDLLTDRARIPVEDMSYSTLTLIVDSAYTTKPTWLSLQDPADNDEIAERLDEVLALLQATDRWLMDELHEIAEDYILENSDR